MKLLVSNDDGIFALGVKTLANTLAEAGHQVTVVCPDQERSATGHSLTLHQPIRAQIVESVFNPSIIAWSCSGTPSDCVKLALGALLSDRPDLVISGINHGSNLGTDLLYSGTVSAAREGVVEEIPSIAVSLASFKYHNFDVAAQFAARLVGYLEQHPLPEVMLLNVNVPAVESSDVKGVLITRQGVRRYIDQFEKRIDPRGKTYYWLSGEAVEDVSQPDHPYVASDVLTDVQAINQNYITISPLKYDLTYPQGIKDLQGWKFS